MRAMEVVKQASVKSGVNLSTISKTIGKSRGYVNAIITRGSEPQINTLVRLLNACNYGVYVIEKQCAPIDAMEITTDEE